jgi:GT2 family glycosyltransferase
MSRAEPADQVSFIVPTLKRPEFLRRCIESLAKQETSPAEVLVGVRSDDLLSKNVVTEFHGRLNVRTVQAEGTGVVGSMNSCLAQANGTLVGIADDDVELPPNWLSRMLSHLKSHANVLGAGGRDLLQDDPARRRAEELKFDVGRIYWFGRISGNHHRGGGEPREIDLLRGSNCLYRGDFLRSVGFETNLRGQGAQVHWELALALQVKKRKKRLFYDPETEVIHHVAPRLDNDQLHRGRFSYEATVDLAFNETFVVLQHGSGLFRFTIPLWQLAIGSPTSPGVVNVIRTAITKRAPSWERVGATMRGRYLAWNAFRRAAKLAKTMVSSDRSSRSASLEVPMTQDRTVVARPPSRPKNR